MRASTRGGRQNGAVVAGRVNTRIQTGLIGAGEEPAPRCEVLGAQRWAVDAAVAVTILERANLRQRIEVGFEAVRVDEQSHGLLERMGDVRRDDARMVLRMPGRVTDATSDQETRTGCARPA